MKTKFKIRKEIAHLNQKILQLQKELEEAYEPDIDKINKTLINAGFTEAKNHPSLHYTKPIKGTSRYYFWFYFDWFNPSGNEVYWGVADDKLRQNYNDIENNFDNFEDAFANFLAEESKYQIKKFKLEFEKEDLVYVDNTEGDLSAWWNDLHYEDGKFVLTEVK